MDSLHLSALELRLEILECTVKGEHKYEASTPHAIEDMGEA